MEALFVIQINLLTISRLAYIHCLATSVLNSEFRPITFEATSLLSKLTRLGKSPSFKRRMFKTTQQI